MANETDPLAIVESALVAMTPGPWNDLRVGRDDGSGEGRSYEAQVCNAEGVGVFIVQHDGSAEGRANVALAMAVPALVERLRRAEAARMDAVWEAAGCLTYAEGATRDPAPPHLETLAMRTVRELRKKYDDLRSRLSRAEAVCAAGDALAHLALNDSPEGTEWSDELEAAARTLRAVLDAWRKP